MRGLKWILGLAVVVVLTGCVTDSGGGDVAGLNQLTAEAATMGQADLASMVTKYKGLIVDKVNVASTLKDQLKEIPVTEMMGEKATALKGDLSDTMGLISQLKDKLAVYTNALKALQ